MASLLAVSINLSSLVYVEEYSRAVMILLLPRSLFQDITRGWLQYTLIRKHVNILWFQRNRVYC